MNESVFFSRAFRTLVFPALLFAASCESNESQPGAASEAAIACAAPTITGSLAESLSEASGLAVSEQHPGVIWMIDDHGATVLHAVDSTGRALGTVNVIGASLRNWEDLGIARCGADTCLYIADIGDNLRNRNTISVYRVPEPDLSDKSTERAAEFTLRYPDGPHDAEAIFILPNERLYIVTKGRSEPITIYRAPALTADTLMLEPVQKLSPSFVQLPDLVTGGAATLDGSRIALRTYSGVQLYTLTGDTLAPLLTGKGVDLSVLHEPQGEGVGIRSDGVLFFNSEQGVFADGRPPISRMDCSVRTGS